MSKKIIAVTACPTGIAHTYLAEESLIKAAKELNVYIKVETNGADGAQNILTAKDIEEADGVIIAADTNNFDVERFNGKPVLFVSVSDGIKKPKDLIRKIIDNAVAVKEGERVVQSVETEGLGRSLYKHLMSGVSNMLPFVVAGGILIAASFLWGIFSSDPKSAEYNQYAAMLMQIGQQAFGIMVPVFTAYIAYSISGKPGLVAGFVGGLLANTTGAGFLGGIIAGFAAGYLMFYLKKWLSKVPRQYEGLKSIFFMPLIGVFLIGTLMILLGKPVAAINHGLMDWLSSLQTANPILLGIVVGMFAAFDFGGPVNKAVYVTGTVLLAQGNYYFMAGVSAACITPPLIIAFATTLFRKAFTEEEKAAGIVNYILGATHITEGAIPFAAKDPLRVIPIMMVGSSISAVLSYVAKITVPAPHGGFLILPLVNHALLWVGCILVGSLVGAVIFGIYRTKQLNKTIKATVDERQVPQQALIISKDDIVISKTHDKSSALNEIGLSLISKGCATKTYAESMHIRESINNTYLENGIAIPHGTVEQKDSVIKTGVSIFFYPEGILWNEIEKARLVIGIAAKNNAHLSVLKQLTSILSDEALNEKLDSVKSEEDIYKIFNGTFVLDSKKLEENIKYSDNIKNVQSETLTLSNENGLHARPCASLVKFLNTFENKITAKLEGKNNEVSGKSMMKMLSLGAKKGDRITFNVEGENAENILKEIELAFKNNLGE